jgi:hypothetical protein
MILIIGTSFQAAYYAVVNYIFFSGKTVFLAGITFSAAIVYVPLAWYAVSRYGVGMLAVVFAFVQAGTFLTVWAVGAHVCRQPWLDVGAVLAAGKRLWRN